MASMEPGETGTSKPLRERAKARLADAPEPTRAAENLSAEEIRRLVYELQVHQIELEIQNEELRRAQVLLEQSRDRYLELYDYAPVGYLSIGMKGLVEEANLTASDMLGVERARLTGQRLSRFVVEEYEDTLFLHRRRLLDGDGPQSIELGMRDSKGRRFHARVEMASGDDVRGESSGYRIVITDISEHKRIEEVIEHLATFDVLTDLPNRRLLLDRLSHALASCRRHRHFGAVLFIDLDNFKDVNDSLGHPTGDALLKEVADRLKETLREEDTSARLGGDEFVVLLSELSDDEEEAAKQAQLGAEKVRKALSRPYKIQNNELHVTPSIGITMIPMEDDGADDILKHADTAMYKAKEAGKNAVRFFLPSMQVLAEQRLKLQNDLHRALESDQFHLHYQPKVNTVGQVISAEALLRWRHPERGEVAPADFIPAAEETRQILAIGEWVLEHALFQLKSWTDEYPEYALQGLAVNVSPRQFHQSDFARGVERLLARSGVDPEYLTLELTEGVLAEQLDDTRRKMQTLKRLGVRFSIDDFGTGYSSLAYLKRLPLDEIKIDRSFVHHLTTDHDDASLVETIITMAGHLGLEVVAEGVETEEQFIFLREKGCRFFQGYWFGRPLEAEDFIRLLGTDKA